MSEFRQSIVDRFRRKMAAGQPIIGGGAGTRASAKREELGEVRQSLQAFRLRVRQQRKADLSEQAKLVHEAAAAVLQSVKLGSGAVTPPRATNPAATSPRE